MRANFYIHIGVHKTGTKSIQHTLSDNRAQLIARGINSFPGDPNHGPILISLLADYPHADTRNIRKHVDTPEKAAAYNASARHEILKALQRNRSPKMVISGEGLVGLSTQEIERLKKLLAPYAASYRIIVYVRDPYEYANSASLQRIKSGSFLGATDRKMPLPTYQRKLGRYIAAFGRENVDIRIFSPKRFVNGDLVSDFFAAIGESPELTKELDVVRANQSMSHEAAMILSEANKAVPMMINGQANRARAFGFHQYVAEIEGEKFVIDPNEYSLHEAEIATDLEWLHRIVGEPVFGRSTPRPASKPRWTEATVSSIEGLVRQMAGELKELRPKATDWPALPAELEWLRVAYAPPNSGPPKTQTAAPQFDQATVSALGRFLHEIALTIQHLKAEQSAFRGSLLIWFSRRAAENHYREVVRLKPSSARGQYRLSQAYLLRGHFVEARKAAEAANELAPRHIVYRQWLKLVLATERWLHKPSPEPAEPVQRRSRHARRPPSGKRPNRQRPHADADAMDDPAASRRPPR